MAPGERLTEALRRLRKVEQEIKYGAPAHPSPEAATWKPPGFAEPLPPAVAEKALGRPPTPEEQEWLRREFAKALRAKAEAQAEARYRSELRVLQPQLERQEAQLRELQEQLLGRARAEGAQVKGSEIVFEAEPSEETKKLIERYSKAYEQYSKTLQEVEKRRKFVEAKEKERIERMSPVQRFLAGLASPVTEWFGGPPSPTTIALTRGQAARGKWRPIFGKEYFAGATVGEFFTALGIGKVLGLAGRGVKAGLRAGTKQALRILVRAPGGTQVASKLLGPVRAPVREMLFPTQTAKGVHGRLVRETAIASKVLAPGRGQISLVGVREFRQPPLWRGLPGHLTAQRLAEKGYPLAKPYEALGRLFMRWNLRRGAAMPFRVSLKELSTTSLTRGEIITPSRVALKAVGGQAKLEVRPVRTVSFLVGETVKGKRAYQLVMVRAMQRFETGGLQMERLLPQATRLPLRPPVFLLQPLRLSKFAGLARFAVFRPAKAARPRPSLLSRLRVRISEKTVPELVTFWNTKTVPEPVTFWITKTETKAGISAVEKETVRAVTQTLPKPKPVHPVRLRFFALPKPRPEPVSSKGGRRRRALVGTKYAYLNPFKMLDLRRLFGLGRRG